MYKETVHDSGLTICTDEMPSTRAAALGVWVRAGSRHETDDVAGVSHFLEHMIFKGSRDMTRRQLCETIEGYGGNMNAFTATECTCYFARVVADHFESAARAIAGAFLHPTLPDDELSRERMVIQEEANMLRDVPMRWVLELFRKTLWPSCALGRSAIGTAETIAAMTRDMMFDYMGRSYGTAGVIFVASGGISHDNVCDIVRDCFADAPQRSSSTFGPAVDARGEPQLTVETRPIEQTHVILGTPSLPAPHEDRHVLSILNVVLGGNKSSRLFEEVRDRRGLAYQISSVAFGLSDAGAFIVQAGVDTSKLCETLDVVMAEMARIACEPVDEEELGRAVEYCRGQFVLEHEDTLNRMLWNGESRLSLGRVPTIDEELAALSAVTPEDVQRVASSLFRNDRLTMAAIGPIDNEDEVRSHLHLPL